MFVSSSSFFKALPSLLLLVAPSAAREWERKSDIRGSKFLDTYEFYTGPDPTHGQVKYSDGPKLTWVDKNNRFNMKVDTRKYVKGNRGSVRISSKYTVGNGVIIANITHVPTGCATWPAFWTLGQGQWPYGGEIDILEWANDAELANGQNLISMHTGPGCYANWESTQDSSSGRLLNANCHTAGLARGCSIAAQPASNSNSRGKKPMGTAAKAFNAQGGSIVAMERDLTKYGKGVRVWQWSRNDTKSIPADVLADNATSINTSNWGTPTASFDIAHCDWAFNEHNIIFDTTLGGDWAGGAWWGGECSKRFGDISNVIQNHGDEFDDAYWSVDSVKHYV